MTTSPRIEILTILLRFPRNFRTAWLLVRCARHKREWSSIVVTMATEPAPTEDEVTGVTSASDVRVGDAKADDGDATRVLFGHEDEDTGASDAAPEPLLKRFSRWVATQPDKVCAPARPCVHRCACQATFDTPVRRAQLLARLRIRTQRAVSLTGCSLARCGPCRCCTRTSMTMVTRRNVSPTGYVAGAPWLLSMR